MQILRPTRVFKLQCIDWLLSLMREYLTEERFEGDETDSRNHSLSIHGFRFSLHWWQICSLDGLDCVLLETRDTRKSLSTLPTGPIPLATRCLAPEMKGRLFRFHMMVNRRNIDSGEYKINNNVMVGKEKSRGKSWARQISQPRLGLGDLSDAANLLTASPISRYREESIVDVCAKVVLNSLVANL